MPERSLGGPGLQLNLPPAGEAEPMHRIRLPFDFFWLPLFLAAALLASTRLPGQCSLDWQASYGGIDGVDGYVQVTNLWDPDGPGPRTPLLVIGGEFRIAGTALASGIAAFDPVTAEWSAMGAGLNGPVTALAVMQSGELVAGGDFTMAGGVPALGVAKWNGVNWSPLGSGISSTAQREWVHALAVLPNGDLVVGGNFVAAGGVSAYFMARWNGASWSPFGFPNGWVRAMATMSNGDLIVGGDFLQIGGQAVNRVARWNGVSWSAIGSGLYNVRAVGSMPNGDILVGGNFQLGGATPSRGVARWDGTSWNALGSGVNQWVQHFATLPNGDLVVGGPFTVAGGQPSSGVARWNGSSWVPWGSSWSAGYGGYAGAITVLPNGDLVADGRGRWNGVEWSPLAPSNDRPVAATSVLPNGDLIIGGMFRRFGGTDLNYIARHDGSAWRPLGSGTNGVVRSLLTLRNGNLIAGGDFTSAGGVSASRVARWDGAAWVALGGGLNGPVHAVVQMPNGDLVVGGSFSLAGGVPVDGIARWDGNGWSAFAPGLAVQPGIVEAMAVWPDGRLAVGGTEFSGVYWARVAVWDGSSWTNFRMNVSYSQHPGWVSNLQVLSNGDLLMSGGFTTILTMGGTWIPVLGVARWNGATWSALGAGPVGGVNGMASATTELPNGDILVSGDFSMAGGVPVRQLARWNGSGWSAVPSGGTGSGSELSGAIAMTQLPDGDIVLGGSFRVVGNGVSAYLARLSTNCPATASAYGAVCNGSNGPLSLTATALPWLGSTYRAQASGVAGNAIACEVYGWNPVSVPLATLHPTGGAGCLQLASMESIRLVAPQASSLQTELSIPNDPNLVGVQLRHQLLLAELNASNHLMTFVSTNALSLTIGSL